MLLDRPRFLPFLREHAATFRNRANELAVARGITDPTQIRSWVSSYQSHVVVRLAKMISDRRWDFGIARASAGNRMWRENERAKTTSRVGLKAHTPHATKDVYFRHMSYTVARCGTTEIVDMCLYLWEDRDRGVTVEPLSWDVYTDDDDATGLRPIHGAEWLSFHVEPVSVSDRVGFPAMAEDVGQEIDDMLRGLDITIPNE